ncbi:hypothetical protein P7K49_027726 [Saguinus oedipus]|uniref:Uncharacterized protein n=1 Tax=Saguinus oedipus TaxID=9490 RepID=A0ABQ9UAA1_SAGOE|nr:hypothetical protein P7K49_027726 [Saguinus oedipus]
MQHFGVLPNFHDKELYSSSCGRKDSGYGQTSPILQSIWGPDSDPAQMGQWVKLLTSSTVTLLLQHCPNKSLHAAVSLSHPALTQQVRKLCYLIVPLVLSSRQVYKVDSVSEYEVTVILQSSHDCLQGALGQTLSRQALVNTNRSKSFMRAATYHVVHLQAGICVKDNMNKVMTTTELMTNWPYYTQSQSPSEKKCSKKAKKRIHHFRAGSSWCQNGNSVLADSKNLAFQHAVLFHLKLPEIERISIQE